MTESTRPHSPHLLKRDTTDNGFSKGWMLHFMPSEEYWTDVHTHLRGVTDGDSLRRMIDGWFYELDAFRLGGIVALTNQDECFGAFREVSDADPRFVWFFWPDINVPSLDKVKDAHANGAKGLKLHNAPIMRGLSPREVYEGEEWQKILAYAAENGLPIVWHVTQRLGYSPYHGGGENAYWSDGWKRGVTFTNEDILQDMLGQMRRHPKLKIIGAHQMHVGPERLAQLFAEYDNLYTDSSCGMYLRWADRLIEEDRIALKNFVETWSERILFGSDAEIRPGGADRMDIQGFLCHPRFMLALGLNDKALQDVAWRNAKNMLGLKPADTVRKKSVRP